MKLIKNYYGLIIFIASYISLFLSFFYNEDGTGSGASGDFNATYGYVLALQNNLMEDPTKWTVVHTPLHYIILSILSYLFHNPFFLRLFFCCLSVILPLLFFCCLKLKFKKIPSNICWILSSVIFFIPAFRYTSIWANDLITSLIFFLFSIYFFLKWENNPKKYFFKHIFFQITFLALATYCRQYYAALFIYFLFIYFKELKLVQFFYIFFICIIFSIPGFFYVFNFPQLLTEQHISILSFSNYLLGNSSMLLIYLFPIFALNIFFKKNVFLPKEMLLAILFAVLFVFFLTINFKTDAWLGGGILYAVSKILFKNNLFFYLTSLLSFFILFLISKENNNNFFVIFITLFVFASVQVYQRYYEPMFYIFFFFLLKTKFQNIFNNNIKACFLMLFYYIFYYFSAVTKILYKF